MLLLRHGRMSMRAAPSHPTSARSLGDALAQRPHPTLPYCAQPWRRPIPYPFAGAPELRALLVGRAAAARDMAAWPAARPLTLRAVMRTGVLGGQPVHFRSHTGDLLLSGAPPRRPPVPGATFIDTLVRGFGAIRRAL